MSRLTYVTHKAREAERVVAFKDPKLARQFLERMEELKIEARKIGLREAGRIVHEAGLPVVAEGKNLAHAAY